MIYYQDFNYNVIDKTIKNNKGRLYNDNIFTFDIEVTSLYIIDGIAKTFDYSKSKEFYKDIEKTSIMYIWQLSINDIVYYGRTWTEFIEFINIIRKCFSGTIIIFVHNLAYEFQFLLNAFKDFDVFARKPHKPIKATIDSLEIEFRCSLMLTNTSLRQLAINNNLEVLKGELDYNVLRTPVTPLNEEELAYCENDCLILYHYLKKELEVYKHIYNIPLTQTGKVRRELKKRYRKNRSYMKWVHNQINTNTHIFNLLLDLFRGGDTHANACYTGQIIENVKSKDLTSSYPFVLLTEQYPVSKFIAVNNVDINNLKHNRCYILKVAIMNVRSKKAHNYISYSKCKHCKNVTVDNGRIVLADYLETVINEIDYEILKDNYEFDIEIIESYEAFKGWLDVTFVKFIIELYKGKTVYKGVENFEDLYMRLKEQLNSLYGMCVTNMIKDEVSFYNGEWKIDELSQEQLKEKLNEQTTSENSFLNFAWGVWVTSYARRNLYASLSVINDDYIYCDTDSNKYKNWEKYEDFFNKYNEEVYKKCLNSSVHYGISINDYKPKDKKGIEHLIGVYEDDGNYDKFKTYGSKKYCYVKDNKIYITVSGLSKKASESLKTIDDFKLEKEFDYEVSGRTIVHYNDEQPIIDVVDYLGNIYHSTDKFGITLQPTTYNLGISDDYEYYLQSIERRYFNE